MIKHCKKCGTETDRYADGHCKPCTRVRQASYRASSADKRDKRREYAALYYEANREKLRSRSAVYYADNQDKIREYRAVNADKRRGQKAAWRLENREKERIHEHNRRTRKLNGGGKLSPDIAEKLYKLQRGKCACGCKQPLGKDFHRDHIMPLALGGSNTDDNIQLLCASCNLQKNKKHPVDFMQQRGFLC